MSGQRAVKLFGLVLVVIVVNVVMFSPGLVGLRIGGGALETAFGVTLLAASVLALLYGSNGAFRRPAAVPVREIATPEDYAEALAVYRRVKVLEADIELALSQLERMKKKQETLLNVLRERFDPAEMSYRKFAAAVQEVEKLFYLNIRSVLNRLNVFDEAEYRAVLKRSSSFSRELLEEKTKVYNDYLAYVKSSLGSNEEMLLKLDKLLLEISRLDSFEAGDIERMPGMREIDELIRQTKLYKQ